MKVIFCRSHLPGSYLIRLVTLSKWSHCALVIKDNVCLEATYPQVRLTTLEEIKRTHSSWEIRELDIEPDMLDWGVQQVGKPYDISGLLGFFQPNRKWQKDDKWFCSELLAAMTGFFQEDGRVTPQMLLLISKKL